MSSIISQNTKNPFSILLVVYMNSKRSKFENPSSLINIAIKFAKKSDKLLKKFKKNNEHIKIPEEVPILEVLRVLYHYSIPDEYLQLLPQEIINQSNNYNVDLDPRTESFNVNMCIEQKLLHLATCSTCAPLDNLAMSKQLLPGAFQPTTKPPSSVSSKLSSSSSSSVPLSSISRNEEKGNDRKNSNRKEEKEKEGTPLPYNPSNVLEEMAWRASRRGPESKKRLPEGQNGPYEQLRQWMLKKQRIYAVIRDNYGIRGSIEGELTAFDHHMNLALKNAREQYRLPIKNFPSLSTQSITTKYSEEEKEEDDEDEEIGQPDDKISDVRRSESMSRDLPRVLVRGDTVVRVNCSVPSTHSLTSSQKEKNN